MILFYSNCLLEAIKAKVKDPEHTKITCVRKSEAGCPHFLWSDGKYDYDFGVEKRLTGMQILWFKGNVRQRALGFNEKYKTRMKKKRMDGERQESEGER